MADHSDLQSIYENQFFRTACNDVLRIVSILSLDSTDVVKPRSKQSVLTNYYEKFVFFRRFLYMVFIKGFTPTVFDILPYTLWTVITVIVYFYRLIFLPFWLRLTGYGKYASWKGLGSKQPKEGSEACETYSDLSLTKYDRLANVNFGDPKYEYLLSKLYDLSAHLSPHSQSPGNPFVHNGFPGNFFDHLTGVYKILLAWKQPQFVMRAGLFHSVYGTFDYRYSLFDLREGRGSLSSLVGEGAEEIAFALCTSDRIGLMKDLLQSMYGSAAKTSLEITSGNIYPPLVGQLTESGYPVRNHITQEVHVLPPDFFAQFIMVTIADFMEQGALLFGTADLDITLFQFLRFRFYNDLLLFVKPYLRVYPPVWEKYMGTNSFSEPQRKEVIELKRIWGEIISDFKLKNCPKRYQCTSLSEVDKTMLINIVSKYNYLAEPRIALAAAMSNEEIIEVRLCI
jgi:hypothetical protein